MKDFRSKKIRARQIQEILNTTIPNPQPPLNYHNSYTLLIAVLLSAQCTDERVNKTTPELFALADTPEKMVELSVEKIREVIRPCGLSPRKSRAIHELSQILIKKYRGIIPKTLARLESLPGVGHKTASVVMIHAHKKAAFPVDTHILRSALRWGLSEEKSVTGVEKDLKQLFPKKDWAKLHLQIILFARQNCPARGHNSAACPICSQLA